MSSLNFLALGDWGSIGFNQSAVAGQMSIYASLVNASFIVTLGDNFYEDGVANDTDPLWNAAYTDVYTSSSLFIPWYPVLGNHDYHQNPHAQVQYYLNHRDIRWTMPDHCYSKIWTLPDGGALEIVFVDTTILSPTRTPETAAGGIHAVPKSLTDAHYHTLEDTLRRSTSTWLIVAGHYTIFSTGGHGDYDELIARLAPLLVRYKVSFYLSGHDHSLNHIHWEGMHYLISGGGGATIQDHYDTSVKSSAAAGLLFLNYSYGFSAFAATSQELTLTMIDIHGDALYSYAFSDPRVFVFNGTVNNFLIPGIVAVMLACCCAFCCVWKWRSSPKLTAPMTEWKDRLLEGGVRLVSANSARGVFEILSDSDDEKPEEDDSDTVVIALNNRV